MSNDIQKDELESDISVVNPGPDAYDSPPLSAITYDEYGKLEKPKKEILMKYYQRIIDSKLQFTHVMKALK